MTKKAAIGRKSVAARSGRPKLAAQRIRDTARELFYRQGIRAVGVDEIVAKAGVTKPSLYRSYASKDELAAACLRDRGDDFLRRFDAVQAARPDSPRDQLRVWLQDLAVTATKVGYRGCGVTNAAVEYPERNHPARKQAATNKQQFRRRLNQLTGAMGARDPDVLADALFLLMEGVYASGQLFGPDGPPRVVALAADALIDAHMREL
jgi:AcrR family transcriptional regulator